MIIISIKWFVWLLLYKSKQLGIWQCASRILRICQIPPMAVCEPYSATRRAFFHPLSLRHTIIKNHPEKRGGVWLLYKSKQLGIQQCANRILRICQIPPKVVCEPCDFVAVLKSTFSSSQIEKSPSKEGDFSMAERKGFEPLIPFWGIHDFQSCALDQLGHLSKTLNYYTKRIYICQVLFTIFIKNK